MARESAPVSVGIVGCGGMGTTHANNVEAFGHEVVGGADVSEAVRESFAREFDAPTYETFDELYAEAPLDAVIVTTPNKFHEPATVAALEAGIDVLCEKPLADTLEGAERIASAADRADAFCTVGFHNRFSTPVTIFEEYKAEGRFGTLTHVDVDYVRRRGIPGIGSWFTNEGLSGGGALVDIGVHVIDLALYLLEYPTVLEVSGIARSNFGRDPAYVDPEGFAGNWDGDGTTFDVDDSATALIRCAGGKTISVDVAWAANRSPSDAVTVRGTDAGAAFSLGEDDLHILETGTAGTDHYADTEVSGSLDRAGHEAELEVFLDGVLAGEAPPENTVEEGLAVQRVVDAIYRSSETGRAVRLADEELEYVSVE